MDADQLSKLSPNKSNKDAKPKIENKGKVIEAKDYKDTKLYNVLKKREMNERLAEHFNESCEIKDQTYSPKKILKTTPAEQTANTAP